MLSGISRAYNTGVDIISAYILKPCTEMLPKLFPAEHTTKSSRSIRRRFIPYRDSILTWLLKDTLGGNSQTIMIANISPSNTCYNETVNTLRFGQRAKLVVSRSPVNEDQREKIIEELKAEIAYLKQLLYSNKNTMDENFPARTHQSVPDVLRNQTFLVLERDTLTSSNRPTSNSIFHSPGPILDMEDILKIHNTNTNKNVDNLKQVPLNQEPSNSIKSSKDEPNIVSAQSSTKERVKLAPSLKRTLSEHATFNINKKITSIFGSQEALTNSGLTKLRKQTPPSSVRRKSFDRSEFLTRNSQRPTFSGYKKSEKGIVTETKVLTNVEPKVNSIRKSVARPRSQIVAAVTQRLYAKSKLKETGTNTDNSNTETSRPRELNICSNARLRLKELTQRALRANRNKDMMTQTELFPVLRVKEISTDVHDLKITTQEMKSVSTMVDEPNTRDASTNCTYLDCFYKTQPAYFRSGFVRTRSCGTQVEKQLDPNNATFSECMSNRRPRTYQRLENLMPNPIHAKSVNISISHYYIDGYQIDDITSHDSLDNEPERLTTPDLISNHNSLEPHNKPKMTVENFLQDRTMINTKFTKASIMTEQYFAVEDLSFEKPRKSKPNYITIPDYCRNVSSITITIFFVTETCIVANQEYRCLPFPPFIPQTAVPKMGEYQDFVLDDCIILHEPLLLKSIMKPSPGEARFIISHDCQSNNISEINYLPRIQVMDSLEYHVRNFKKVHFDNENNPERDKLIEIMSNFFEEATVLLTNMKSASLELNNLHTSFPSEFDLEMTIDDISAFFSHHPSRKYEQKYYQQSTTASTQTDKLLFEDDFCRTVPIVNFHNCTQCDEGISVNKHETVLKDSCERLKEVLRTRSTINNFMTSSLSSDDLNPQDNLSYYSCDLNLSHCHNYNDFSSSESNAVTLSDYGSLPRRYSRMNRSNRISSCSPSAFLKQLTNMRKQVIDSSREELLENVKCEDTHSMR